MVRATTPTYVLTFTDIDLMEAEAVYVTIRQGAKSVTKTGTDLEVGADTITFMLTQEDTLTLEAGSAELQVNLLYPGGVRASSNIVGISVSRNLYPRVIENV